MLQQTEQTLIAWY